MQLVSKIFKLCGHDPPTSQTDGQTTCDSKTTLCTVVHRAVKKTKNAVDCITAGLTSGCSQREGHTGPAPKLSQIFAINVHVGCRRPVLEQYFTCSIAVSYGHPKNRSTHTLQHQHCENGFKSSMMVTIGRRLRLDVDNQ